jgi:acetate kinase
MRVLVINSGSSSLKFSLFAQSAAGDVVEPHAMFSGEVSDIGENPATLAFDRGEAVVDVPERTEVHAATPLEALRLIFDLLGKPGMPAADAIGYRVVHPGAQLVGHQQVTAHVLAALEEAKTFAPLHDPSEIALIREGMARFPDLPHYVCFDTEFHRTMPESATTYAIPLRYRAQGVRRFGFHGLSCESIVKQMSSAGTELPRRLAIAHLGSGCSVTAVLDGSSVDTTMGMTPTGGVVMGTRPGDLDPGTVLYLLRQQEGDAAHAASALEAMLNREAGLLALSGQPNNMKDILHAAQQGDAGSALALDVFARSITKALGGFCWLMGGIDAIVFTGGIGEHVPLLRARILAGLEGLNITVDTAANQRNQTDLHRIDTGGIDAANTDAAHAAVAIYVIPSQEDLMIASHVFQLATATT